MSSCVISRALVKSVPPSVPKSNAAVSSSSGELVKSFSMDDFEGSWLRHFENLKNGAAQKEADSHEGESTIIISLPLV